MNQEVFNQFVGKMLAGGLVGLINGTLLHFKETKKLAIVSVLLTAVGELGLYAITGSIEPIGPAFIAATLLAGSKKNPLKPLGREARTKKDAEENEKRFRRQKKQGQRPKNAASVSWDAQGKEKPN